MPDPTPNLTAEERARSCVVDGYKSHHPMSMDAVIHELGEATRQAFEEAAEIRPPQPRLAEPENMHDYLEGWVDAVAAYTDAIRALAKEQGGLVISKHLLEPKK